MEAAIPFTYTSDDRKRIVQHVLTQVACGRSVGTILKHDDGMPALSCFWTWHFADVDLQDGLARAREIGVEARLEKAQQIADGDDLDRHADGTLVNPADAYLMDTKRAALRANMHVKLAQMIAPRKYGPKLDLTSEGRALAGQSDGDTASRAITVLGKVEKRLSASTPDDRTLDLLS